ncbi:c-type cytochrome [Marinicella meishanensis]|uniref:c-type cytochrome n=1 Tax=Marinicella meishanensis TaxID=2873263 RepID=UPI001CC1AD99|nr:cytochrome c [Marinicella sp. NBU2979]
MKKTIPLTILSAIFMLTFIPAAQAGDPEAGKAKSVVCAACHGADGISPNDLWPNLAGQKEGYLVKQIKAFKNGERKDPSMAPMVAALTDEDIANLAAYYASLK